MLNPLKRTPRQYRAGDRVAAWGEVVMTPSAGPGVAYPGKDGGHYVVPLSHVAVAEHVKTVQDEDRVTYPGAAPGEHGVVKFLVDDGGRVLRRDQYAAGTFACVYVEGMPPTFKPVSALTRLDD